MLADREPTPRGSRVLILAPTGRDAEVVGAVLREAGIASERCGDVQALCRGVERGAGAALIAEEALSPAAIATLNATLGRQAPWSDLPIVLVTGAGEHQDALGRTLRLIEPSGNVTVLERPFRKLTLVTAFETALRTRRRQYRMRDVTAELFRAEQERAQAQAVRRSEALYRALARNYPNGAVLLVDRELRCKLAEGRGLAHLGLSSQAAEGYPLREVLPPELASRLELCHRAALAGQATVDEVPFQGRIHLVHGAPLHASRDTVEVVMIVTQDITEQKRAEEELRRDAEFRERFIGVLAHDLRTPLQAISLTAERLSRMGLPEGPRACAERIGRSAGRMTRMIHDLLDFTRIRQGGEIPIAPETADLVAICRRAIEEIQAAHPGRAIAFTHRGDASGLWDEGRIAQVVSNLVGNALAYSPPDTPVSVELRADDGAVVLDVSNRGEPILPEAIPALFDPFKRGPNKGTGLQARQGLGLGLFIVARIIRAHGGAIRVTSTEEKTTFTVTLPRSPARAQASGALVALPRAALPARAGASHGSTEGAASPARAPAGQRHQVLVVEDDPEIRDTVREMLEEVGYRVATAENGREALEILARGARPCVILLDLMMPEMSGWQVLEALRRDDALASLPVVLLSAAVSASEPPEGARRCISKPIHRGNLLAAVEAHCASPAGC